VKETSRDYFDFMHTKKCHTVAYATTVKDTVKVYCSLRFPVVKVVM